MTRSPEKNPEVGIPLAGRARGIATLDKARAGMNMAWFSLPLWCGKKFIFGHVPIHDSARLAGWLQQQHYLFFSSSCCLRVLLAFELLTQYYAAQLNVHRHSFVVALAEDARRA